MNFNENDSDDVRGFVTLGGQVSWAVNAYRYMDSVRVEPQDQNSQPPEIQEDIHDDDNVLWDRFMRSDAPVESQARANASGSITSTIDPENPFDGAHSQTLLATQVIVAPPPAPSNWRTAAHTSVHTSSGTSVYPTNAEASSSSVKVKDVDDQAAVISTGQMGPARNKGNGVARHAPYLSGKTVASAITPSGPGGKKGGRRGFGPMNPPPGWVTHYLYGNWTPDWTWHGEQIPSAWGPHNTWDELKSRYQLTNGTLCGWKDCATAAAGATPDLRKHTLGVHLGCTYRCLGCGLIFWGRYDNWSERAAKKAHELGCPTDAFWHGEITKADLEELLAERAERAADAAEDSEGEPGGEEDEDGSQYDQLDSDQYE